LKTFNLRDLTELPTLREFHELGDEEAAKVRQKHPPKQAAAEGEAAATQAAPAPDAAPSGAFSPSAPLPDRPEDEELLDELDRAAEAAARALGGANPPPDPSSGPA
jgi:segregation and condensation protein B